MSHPALGYQRLVNKDILLHNKTDQTLRLFFNAKSGRNVLVPVVDGLLKNKTYA